VTPPRVPPLDPGELTPRQREILDGHDDLNVLRTMVRHPGLCQGWLQFGRAIVDGGDLTRRVWELVVLRTAVRCDCSYEWGQHAPRAGQAGLTEEDVRRCGDASPATGSDELSVLLRAVDELVVDHRLSDETWNELGGLLPERDIFQLMLLAGLYALLAGVVNSVQVEPERPLPPLGQPV
jgi:alkylhydroperoxidase family enzyme